MSSGLKGFSSARQEARRRLDDGLKSMASENDENPPVTCTLVCLGETSDMSPTLRAFGPAYSLASFAVLTPVNIEAF